jgi:hypothetical protein
MFTHVTALWIMACVHATECSAPVFVRNYANEEQCEKAGLGFYEGLGVRHYCERIKE